MVSAGRVSAVPAVSATGSGLPGRELVRRALAFRDGRVEGLAVLDESWDPDPAEVSAGRALLGPGSIARRNRVTLGQHQLRLGRDGAWYPFRKERAGGWSPDGAPIAAIPDDRGVGDLLDDADTR